MGKRAWSVASLLIIVLVGITSAICAKGVLESLVSRHVDDWFKDRPAIYTSQLSDAQKASLFNEGVQRHRHDTRAVLVPCRVAVVSQAGWG